MLGPTGLSAYFGALDVGRLNEGETVLVSGGGRGRRHLPGRPGPAIHAPPG
jgi:hypothetical protein